MKVLFLNPMSRNGTSLVYQLLLGHPQLRFLPGRIHFVCQPPRGWPFFNFQDGLYSGLLDRHRGFSGKSWDSYQEFSISTLFNPPQEPELSDQTSVQEAVELYLSSVLSHFGLPPVADDQYLILQEDHLFAIGTQAIRRLFPASAFVQPIRNLYDVISSKKNLLLLYSGCQVDPKSVELTHDALFSETVRWMWSIFVAHLNTVSLPEDYVLLKFENLRGPAREAEMRYFCMKLGIDFEPILLEETWAEPLPENGLNALSMVGSTLKRLPKAHSDRRVKSYEVSLHPNELEWLEAFLAKVQPLPEEQPLNEAVQEYFLKNREVHPLLVDWTQRFQSGESLAVYEDYAALNFGKARLSTAFKNLPITEPR